MDVEAIEEGRIVRVSEEYAKREGLPILRRSESDRKEKKLVDEAELIRRKEFPGRGVFEDHRVKKGILSFEEFRRPLRRSESDVTIELKDNFHWDILKRRKERGIARKDFARDLGVSEEEVRMVENGRLPRNDFVLINKIQSYLGLNLRKDGKDFTNKSAREMIEKTDDNLPGEEGKEESGKEIEIIDD